MSADLSFGVATENELGLLEPSLDNDALPPPVPGLVIPLLLPAPLLLMRAAAAAVTAATPAVLAAAAVAPTDAVPGGRPPPPVLTWCCSLPPPPPPEASREDPASLTVKPDILVDLMGGVKGPKVRA